MKLVEVLLNMFKVLELSGLFVCLGGLVKILSAWGTEEIGGLWFAKGDQYPGWHYVINLRKITSRDWKILAGGSGVAIK